MLGAAALAWVLTGPGAGGDRAPEPALASSPTDSERASAPPPTDWEPASAPPPTAWARAGARGWRLCDDVGRQAAALRGGGATRGGGAGDSIWRKRARQCPHVPEVLMLAAEVELLEAARLDWGPDMSTGLDRLVQEHARRIRRAMAYLTRAIEESERRGSAAPLETRYYLAYTLVALGRYDRARRALAAAIREGDVEGWRSDYMGAIIELFVGDLDAALLLAHRSVTNAPSEDRTIARYIWALVLDRVGAPAASRAEFDALRREAGFASQRDAVASLLPVHERLYFFAIDHQARGGDRSLAMRLWDAYLERPEPAQPDKELARRHQLELKPPPPPVR